MAKEFVLRGLVCLSIVIKVGQEALDGPLDHKEQEGTPRARESKCLFVVARLGIGFGLVAEETCLFGDRVTDLFEFALQVARTICPLSLVVLEGA